MLVHGPTSTVLHIGACLQHKTATSSNLCAYQRKQLLHERAHNQAQLIIL
jgi:hypothetical protein